MNNYAAEPEAIVNRLTLHHFRNYDSLDIALDAGIHLVSGQNAQGKTNLLEALYLLSTTRLLRGQKDSEAIQEGFGGATVCAEVGHSSTSVSVVLDRSARKRVLLNGLALPRASDVLGRLPCVCISSADLSIVHGEPSDRRLFLDLELSQLYPAYLRHLAVYRRALDHRNALLKTAATETYQRRVVRNLGIGAGGPRGRSPRVQDPLSYRAGSLCTNGSFPNGRRGND